jgi:hypothetical protein
MSRSSRYSTHLSNRRLRDAPANRRHPSVSSASRISSTTPWLCLDSTRHAEVRFRLRGEIDAERRRVRQALREGLVWHVRSLYGVRCATRVGLFPIRYGWRQARRWAPPPPTLAYPGLSTANIGHVSDSPCCLSTGRPLGPTRSWARGRDDVPGLCPVSMPAGAEGGAYVRPRRDCFRGVAVAQRPSKASLDPF